MMKPQLYALVAAGIRVLLGQRNGTFIIETCLSFIIVDHPERDTQFWEHRTIAQKEQTAEA